MKTDNQRWLYARAQAIANVSTPERDDPLAFWCLVELIVATTNGVWRKDDGKRH